MDAAGNNVAIYYLPYDSDQPDANIQLYYVVIKDAAGNVQFTRQAWPNTSAADNGAQLGNNSNLLSNSQFADVLFIPGQALTITIAGAGDTSLEIAPGWTLDITTNGASNVTVTQTPIAGNAALPTNPPFTLDIVAGANITALTLTQKLVNNPDIWSRAAGGANGWVATSIVAGAGTQLSIDYLPSNGAAQRLLDVNNVLGVPQEFANTVQLAAATNPDTGTTGFVDIVINLPLLGPSSITSVQVFGLDANIQNFTYDQEPTNRQRDHLFHYYNPQLRNKPISSYLVGWDFPFNPAQFLGPTLAASGAGDNTSRYVWDQTIVFQTTNTGPAISQTAAGALRVTATNASQFALIQYLSQTDARKILNNRLSVNVSALTNVVAGLGGTISLWYTANPALPSCAANNSIVATLAAAGKPATFNTGGAGDTWHEVPRLPSVGGTVSNEDATFTVMPSANTNFNDYGFSGWDMQGVATVNTATFFAIVVGFAQLPIGNTIDFNSISLVPGDIPTRPAPQSDNRVIDDCSYYYQKSFKPRTIPATAVGSQTGEAFGVQTAGSATNSIGPIVTFPVQMISSPALTFYNPVNNNAQIRSEGSAADWTLTTGGNITVRGFFTTGTTPGGSAIGNNCGLHWTADSRLGK
jgi:hypothetical protein